MTLEIALRNRAPALDLAFAAPPGLTAIFGPSGAGKTSILRAVAGLLRPEEGRIALAGRVLDGAPHRRRIGYVFQEPRLLPHLSVAQNMAYGAPGADPGPLAERLGIAHLLQARPARLSGGEAQRVAIGRALLPGPELLLMDEPLASLDAPRREALLPVIEDLRDRGGVPILYVSHSVSEVARLATTLVLIEAGRLVAAGPVAEILSDPAHAALFGAGGAGAVLTARIGDTEAGLTRLESAAGPLFLTGIAGAPGSHVRVRVRADDVILSRARPEGLSALNILPGRVLRVEPQGQGVLVQLELGPAPAAPDLDAQIAAPRLLARVTPRSVTALGLAPGVAVHAVLKAAAVAPADIGALARDETPR